MDPNSSSMLNDLLNDPAKLQSALSAASSLLGGSGGQPPAPPRAAPQSAAPPQQPAPMVQPPMMSGASGARPAAAYDPSAELMSRVMPVLHSIARSGRTAINQDRANLLQSFKPFVTENVGGQFDHAIRLVSIARMAKNAMIQLGSSGEDSPSGDGVRSL